MTLCPCARPIRLGLISAVALAAFFAVSPHAAQAEVERCHLDAEQVFAKAEPKILEIFSDAINQFRVSDRIQSSLGTGFLLQNGVVVTNYHVIADAQRIEVFDGTDSWRIDVLGIDPLLDIAVLKIPYYPDNAEGIDLASPASVKTGQQVYAIGFPQGLGKSITQGIVTGTGRVLADSTNSWLSPFIQTDATVNSGNSGGPLLDDCGRAIGMVSRSILSGATENIAFAIPVDVLAPIVDEIVATGRVSRAWHGLYGQMVTPPVLALMGVPPDMWQDFSGFMVETVEPGSAADTIGIAGGEWHIEIGGHPYVIGGDIITEVNGTRIQDRSTALQIVRNLKVGEEISIVYRRGPETIFSSVVLPERPILEEDLDLYRH
jgi:serine protease Do